MVFQTFIKAFYEIWKTYISVISTNLEGTESVVENPPCSHACATTIENNVVLDREMETERGTSGHLSDLSVRPAEITAAHEIIHSGDYSSYQPEAQVERLNDAIFGLDTREFIRNDLGGGPSIAIFGGQFIRAKSYTHNNQAASFNTLQTHVSASALHDSLQRVDPPQCHPGTRVEILQTIYDWITISEHRQKWLLWLNGAAGAGKSAIMQSTAERCVREYIAIASFFFMGSDATRNRIDSVVATHVYQLIKVIPDTLDEVLLTIDHDPLIFDQSFQSQFNRLIILPLIHLPYVLQRPFAIFIDGLDECIDQIQQSNLLKFFGDISSTKSIPLVIIVASRREPQILSEFGSKKVSQLLEIVPLDESKASDDIRRFFNAKFADIKENHNFRHLLLPDWPSVLIVTELVEKASEQFIYASVVIKYISSPRANPARRLEIVRDLRLRHPSSEHPFAYLDSLYRHIFSRVAVEQLDYVLTILAFCIWTGIPHVGIFESVFMLTSGELEVFFSDLTAILEFKLGKLKFLHASLPDFLQDKSRSEEYHLDLEEYRNKLLCIFFEMTFEDPPLLRWLDDGLEQPVFQRLNAIGRLLQAGTSDQKSSDKLRRAVMNFDSTIHSIEGNDNWQKTRDCVRILNSLKKLDFGDHGQAYRHILDVFAEQYARLWPSLNDLVKNQVRSSVDLCACICQHCPELSTSVDLRILWFPFPEESESSSERNIL
ncbi:hypothetical protein BDN70DRAFT_879554 [Pholiota conissans]|uniref:Nephrocystin 3-like N-terminal domain-containing protein n=1 Tax=Pholiota conissans TaxID=109636 RepID=A0A9P6CSY4_9AGAR|nr:hypothetical protein BDN70DRAFT_879554 [Pholiota conissans]